MQMSFCLQKRNLGITSDLRLIKTQHGMTNTFEDLKIREISHCHDVRCLALAAAYPLLLYAEFRSISRSAPIGIVSAFDCAYHVVCLCGCQRGIFWVNRLWWRRLQRFIKLLGCRGWQSVRDYRQTGTGSVCVCVFLSAPYPPHRWWW